MPMPQLGYDNWRTFKHDGAPPDGEWCICLFGHGKTPDVFVGGYDAKSKIFYANFGLGGAVLEAADVGAWIPISEFKWDGMRDLEAERHMKLRRTTMIPS